MSFWILIMPLSFSYAGVCPKPVSELIKKNGGSTVSCVSSGRYILVLSGFFDSVESDLAGVTFQVLDAGLMGQGLRRAALNTVSGLGEEVVPLKCGKTTKSSCDFSSDLGERMIFQAFVPPRAGHIYSLRLTTNGKLINEIPEESWFSEAGTNHTVTATEARIFAMRSSSEGKLLAPQKFIYKNGRWSPN
jgi:hypothetical protein